MADLEFRIEHGVHRHGTKKTLARTGTGGVHCCRKSHCGLKTSRPRTCNRCEDSYSLFPVHDSHFIAAEKFGDIDLPKPNVEPAFTNDLSTVFLVWLITQSYRVRR